MVIDLRSEPERQRNPQPSDVIINVPIPPLSGQAICEMAEALLEVAPMAQGKWARTSAT